MKESVENSFSDANLTDQLEVESNNINPYREILNSREYLSINLKHFKNSNNININITSYLIIIQMLQEYPEKIVKFIFKEKKLSYSNKHLNFSNSNSSILNNKEESSSFSMIKLQSSKKKKLKEEIINTDIMQTKTYEGNINNNLFKLDIDNNSEKMQNENEKEKEEEKIINNIKNIQLFSANPNTKKNNNEHIIKTKKINNKTSADKKLVLFKWIYHFYIILSIIIFVHYLTFIFSDYNYSNFYKISSLALIICSAFVGYIKIKYKYTNPPFFLFKENYLFWIHFFILILTILSLSGFLLAGGKFKFIKSQGIFGYLIALVYIISLIIESFYCLYYDAIIEEINWERNNNNVNKMNDYIDNNLNIQLTEID